MTQYQSDLSTLLIGVLAVLVTASTIGFVLSLRATSDTHKSVIENLNTRIKAWWFMVFLLGLAFWFPAHLCDIPHQCCLPTIQKYCCEPFVLKC